jgi:hypothetical protein
MFLHKWRNTYTFGRPFFPLLCRVLILKKGRAGAVDLLRFTQFELTPRRTLSLHFVLKGYIDAASLGIALLKNPLTLQLLSQSYATNISALAYPVFS